MLGHEQRCLTCWNLTPLCHVNTFKTWVCALHTLESFDNIQNGTFSFVGASRRLNRSLKRLHLKAKDFAVTKNVQLNTHAFAKCENRCRKSLVVRCWNMRRIDQFAAESEVLTSQAATSLTREGEILWKHLWWDTMWCLKICAFQLRHSVASRTTWMLVSTFSSNFSSLNFFFWCRWCRDWFPKLETTSYLRCWAELADCTPAFTWTRNIVRFKYQARSPHIALLFKMFWFKTYIDCIWS